MVRDDSGEDAALARRIVGGDRAAEAELCRRMLPRVRAWGLKHLRDEVAALDLAQRVMLAVLEALRDDRVTEVDRIAAFVLGVCKHSVAAMRRGEQRRADLLARFGAVLAEAPSSRAASGLDHRRLATCFERLAPRAQAVLALAYFAERSNEEIASETGLSAGNVRVVRHRALAQLHACMEGAA